MDAFANNSGDSHPPTPIRDAYTPYQMRTRNVQGRVGEATHAFSPINIGIHQANIRQGPRINNSRKMLAIAQLTTKTGWAIDLCNNVQPISVYQNNGATSHQISKISLGYDSIIKNNLLSWILFEAIKS